MITDIEAITSLQGRNIGLVVGIEQTGITLSGSGTSWVIPEEYLPVFPMSCVSFTPIGTDIILYEDGVVSDKTITDIDEETGTITTSGSLSGTVTADFVEEFEPYLAQNVKVDVKQDEQSYGILRSDMKHKSYGAREVTISEDNLLGDLEPLIKICFEDYDGDAEVPADVEAFQMVSEPREMYAYIPMEKGDEIVGRMYFPQVRAVLSSLLDVKEGDNAQFSLDITVDKDPIIIRPIVVE